LVEEDNSEGVMERKVFILVLSLLFISSLAFAETIHLKSGKTYEGKIVERTDEYIKIDIGVGFPITYFLDEIERIDKTSHTDISEKTNDISLSGIYINNIYGFSISNPKGWKRFENVQTPFGTKALVYYSLNSSPVPYIGITYDSILPFPDVKNVMDFTLKMLEQLKRSGAVVLQDPSYVQVGDGQATRMKLIHPVKINDEDVYVVWYQVSKDSGVITISLTDVASQFDKRNSVFEKMIETFKLIPRDSPVFGRKEDALFRAIADNDLGKIRKLLDEGASVNAREPDQGATPLILAVIGGNQNIAKLLISHGADVNLGDSLNTTPLIYAVALHKKNMVELLVLKGADLDIKDNAGYTALMTAQESPAQNAEIIEILKKAPVK